MSRTDIDRDGPTYTRDTLRQLRTDNPDAELFFITGADALAQILGWHAAEELFDLAHFIGVTRPGYTLELDTRFPEGSVSLLEVPGAGDLVLGRAGTGSPRRAGLVPRPRRCGPLHRQATALSRGVSRR